MTIADVIFLILILSVFIMLGVKSFKNKASKKERTCTKCTGCSFSKMCGKKF